MYDTVQIFRNRKSEEPIVTLKQGEMVSYIIDDATKNGETKKSCRSYKLLELKPDGSELRLWISNALDISNDMLWHPQTLLAEVISNVGAVPPVSLIGGEDEELAREIFLPSWEISTSVSRSSPSFSRFAFHRWKIRSPPPRLIISSILFQWK